MRSCIALRFVLLGFLLRDATSYAQPPSITFADVTKSAGLADSLELASGKRPWRYAHGAAWGDVNGDGRPDLFVGAFAGRKYFQGDDAPQPNWLFLNGKERFSPIVDSPVQALEGNARCAGSLFLDLDGDSDLDLVVTNHVQTPTQGKSKLYENLGGGTFRDRTPEEAPWNQPLGLRNIGTIDFNRDGLLDLILVDGSYGKEKAAAAKLLVLKNAGDFRFTEASSEYGFPQEGTAGLGLALGDVNDDGRTDLFVAGCNRMFVSGPGDKYYEHPTKAFAIKPLDGPEGAHCGAALADFNGDGLLDLVTTEHGVPTMMHLFRNLGVKSTASRVAFPEFEEVTVASGIGTEFPRGTKQRPIKTAHIAARDVDNDGRIDLITTLIKQSAAGEVQPVVLRNIGERRGEIRFEPIPMQELIGYYAPGPVADYDRDGRIDLFLPSWFEDVPNYLFRNTSAGPAGVTVRVTSSAEGMNRLGIGAVISAYAAGKLGSKEHLISRCDLTIGNGYASGEEALAHLGIGNDPADLRVVWQGVTIDRANVRPGEFVTIEAKGQVAEKQTKKGEKKESGKVIAAAWNAPELSEGKAFVSYSGPDLLAPPENFNREIAIAKQAPRVEFMYYPGQTYEGKPWSNWGDTSFAQGKYFSAIGDHLAPRGNAFVYAYDPESHKFTLAADITKTLNPPEGHYAPGKVHTHVELGRDGKLYFATHRGSTRATTDANHFLGESILSADLAGGTSEIAGFVPVPKHCIPNGMLDRTRLIYYGGTAPGTDDLGEGIQFFAYDLTAKKLLFRGPEGPARAMMLAASTGILYYTPGSAAKPLMRYDAASSKPPVEIPGEIGLRAATDETRDGKIYTVSAGGKEGPAELFAFDVKTETIERLGPAAVGSNEYIASIKADPAGRYLYYVPGAHGGADRDGSPIVRFDLKTRKREVVAFLHPALEKRCGAIPKGTYGLALDDRGERLFITWNMARSGVKNWDCCGLTVIHLPTEAR